MKTLLNMRANWLAAVLVIALLSFATAPSAHAQAEPFVGQLALVGFDFAPEGWLLCQGQTLQIAQYPALYSLLGTRYGGNGSSTFMLPDLRGRVPIGYGQGSGLTNREFGSTGGAETQTLTLNQMPVHTHALSADPTVGTSDIPTGGVPARNGAGVPQYGTGTSTTMSAAAVQTTGGGQPHSIMQPYLTLNWIIAVNGIYPTRP
jgi:microcystin-dependent protein